MRRFHKVIKIFISIVFLFLVGAVLYYGNRSRNESECKNIEIRFTFSPQLSDKFEIYQLIRKYCDSLEGTLKININQLEKNLDEFP